VSEFPSSVERGKLALSLLEEAYRERDAEDLHCVLTVGFKFGFGPEHMDILRQLVTADWHDGHEDVVSALGSLPNPQNANALFMATQWIPESLEYDEVRALAVKAIWALGETPGEEAKEKLDVLARSDDPILRRTASQQLARQQRAEPDSY
jgi:hypothetical protein